MRPYLKNPRPQPEWAIGAFRLMELHLTRMTCLLLRGSSYLNGYVLFLPLCIFISFFFLLLIIFSFSLKSLFLSFLNNWLNCISVYKLICNSIINISELGTWTLWLSIKFKYPIPKCKLLCTFRLLYIYKAFIWRWSWFGSFHAPIRNANYQKQGSVKLDQ